MTNHRICSATYLVGFHPTVSSAGVYVAFVGGVDMGSVFDVPVEVAEELQVHVAA